MATAKSDVTVYKLEKPPVTLFNPTTGQFEPPKFYSTGKFPIAGVHIVDGKGETTDPRIALEFVDMGYTVTPDPRPALQEAHLKDLTRETESDPDKKPELDKYAAQVASWRAQHS